jgi:sirohydrochlorin ferrochelatase
VTPLTGRRRRSQLRYLAVLPGTSPYNRRARLLRTALGLAALALVLTSEHAWLAVPLVLLGLLGPVLNHLMELYRRGWFLSVPPLRLVADVNDRSEGRHQLNLPAQAEIVGLLALVASFSWVATDLPGPLRLAGLLLAVTFGTSVAHSIYADHTWFNPAETTPPRWHELLRLFAGPSTALMVAVVALPAPWPGAERVAVTVIVALSLIVSVRLWDLDETVAVLDDIAEEERRRGRDLVVAETERALAQPLADLEELARPHRQRVPILFELAVHARTRLSDTLQASGDPYQPPPTIDELLGPVLTLARAVGVSVQVDLLPETLTEPETELAGWALRDLVGNAINAGGNRIRVTVARSPDELVVSVTDDAPPMPAGVWKSAGTSSERLERHLVSVGGSLEAEGAPTGKTVTARWQTALDGERGVHERADGPGAAR